MLSFNELLTQTFKGAFVGMGAVIPGVSGGTAAMIIGIFEEILESTANFFKHIRKSITTLLPISAGVILGAYFTSILLNLLNSCFPFFAKSIYCAISLFSTVMFAKRNLKERHSILSFIIGVLCALILSLPFTKTSVFSFQLNFISVLSIGFILSLALVLPALSFSYMLLYFGVYEHFINAITSLDLTFLFPLAIGLMIGSFLFSKLLLHLIESKSKETYSFVFGFVVCSIIDIITKMYC